MVFLFIIEIRLFQQNCKHYNAYSAKGKQKTYKFAKDFQPKNLKLPQIC